MHSGYFFPRKKYVLALTKNWFGYILGCFSQTHLVTLDKHNEDHL
jgi:hypothetical protein